MIANWSDFVICSATLLDSVRWQNALRLERMWHPEKLHGQERSNDASLQERLVNDGNYFKIDLKLCEQWRVTKTEEYEKPNFLIFFISH